MIAKSERTDRGARRPLLDRRCANCFCAGLTTFSALRDSPAKAGDLVAVLGIGGLGHLGVQYARHMGFEVAAIGAARQAISPKKLGHTTTSTAPRDPAKDFRLSEARP